MGMLAKIRISLVVAATLGLLVPNPALARGHTGRQIQDVSLQAGGKLQGAILTSAGKPAANQAVQLLADDQVVARIVTGPQGRFSVSGIRAGVYSIRSDDSQSVYRLWSADAAPPSARPELLLITDDGQVVRGGGRFGSSRGNMLLMGGLILAAGAIGGVIGYNIRDDAS